MLKNVIHFLCSTLVLLACSKEDASCEGPDINSSAVQVARRGVFESGPQARLIIPDPIESNQFLNSLHLAGLNAWNKLENTFLKIRIRSTSDNPNQLAKPGKSGAYQFDINDIHYSETMAYYSTTALINYVENLGFTLNKTRPLYIFVRSDPATNDPNEVNAFFENNTLDPRLPRIMKMVGNTKYAPAIARDMYWHEAGHFINEGLSSERGIDRITEEGGMNSQGAAIHECLADGIAEFISDRPYIGYWIAKNFPDEIPDGNPLRSAVDQGDLLKYDQVSLIDKSGNLPDRYVVAEWCSRVLWTIRKTLVEQSQETGAIKADTLLLTSISFLPKNSTFSDLREALIKADEGLYCGKNSNSIRQAFEERGFRSTFPTLSKPLALTASPVLNGRNVTFTMKIGNPNSQIARNVRVALESSNPNLFLVTPIQSYGDLVPGAVLQINPNSITNLDYSVSAEISTAARGKLPYRLKVIVDNGPETTFGGTL